MNQMSDYQSLTDRIGPELTVSQSHSAAPTVNQPIYSRADYVLYMALWVYVALKAYESPIVQNFTQSPLARHIENNLNINPDTASIYVAGGIGLLAVAAVNSGIRAIRNRNH